MTVVHSVRWLILTAAVLFRITVGAQDKCPPTPEKYRDLEFGDVRFAVEEDCRRAFTQNEQFFLAGVTGALRSNCKLPRDRKGRALVEQFTKAAALSLELKARRGPLQDRVPSRPGRAAAFATGKSMMEDIRCNGPEAALLARGIVIYLDRTSGSSRFITGCMELYADRYGEKQCRCIADTVRSVFPDVDQRFFDREIVKDSIHQSPRTALTLMLSCGVQNY
ncbi:MAG TPA: hypothetical protein VEO54_12635 [Thermoanaerobaculia bacterium]|nr:hypothetical protein [Thermoanaerobaculia bacterium]